MTSHLAAMASAVLPLFPFKVVALVHYMNYNQKSHSCRLSLEYTQICQKSALYTRFFWSGVHAPYSVWNSADFKFSTQYQRYTKFQHDFKAFFEK